MSFGLCVSPGNVPDSTELTMLRPSFLRSLIYSMSDLDGLLATGLPILLTLNNECQDVGWDWSGWDGAIQQIASRSNGRVLALSCANELDLFNSRNPSDVPPEFAADLVRRASPILRAAGIKAATTSLAGPNWQEYLAQMFALCGEGLDLVDLHAYGQRPDGWGATGWMWGDLRPTLIKAHQIAGKPVIMSEYGVKVGDAGGEDQVAAFLTAGAATVAALGPDVCPMVSWFAWRDQVGAPDERGDDAFGLVADDGRLRPAWSAYAALAPSVIDVVSPASDPPLPAPEPVPVHTNDQEVPAMPPLSLAYRQLWQAVVPLPYDETIEGFGIPTYWREHLAELGSPLGPEIDEGDGKKIQSFALGIVRWTGDGVERVA